MTGLVVMPADRRGQILRQLEGLGLRVQAASDCAQAGLILETSPSVALVFVAHDLPDKPWTSLLPAARRGDQEIPVVVCLERLDGGWVDLLEAGARGFAVEPYERRQIEGVLRGVFRLVPVARDRAPRDEGRGG